MEPTAATPPEKPKQTAKRTSNFRPWAGTGSRTATPMTPASPSVSPQNPSPVKIISDLPSGINGYQRGSQSSQTANPSAQGGGGQQHGRNPVQTPMSKEGSLSMTARIQQAQKQWEAKQSPRLSMPLNEVQGEASSNTGVKSESTVTDGAQKSKPSQESPVPLPSYAHHYIPGATKRSATEMDGSLDTPLAKRQQALAKDAAVSTTSRTSSPTGSGAMTPVSAPRTVNVGGRIMQIIDVTGDRKYSEYWVSSQDGNERELTAAGGGLLPLEYEPLQTDDHPWICPVRECRKRMSELRRLGGHVFASHTGKAFNDNKDGTISEIGFYQREDGKTAPPVIVSCKPLPKNAPPPRKPWMKASVKDKARPSIASVSSEGPSHPPLTEATEYLHQFLSHKQREPKRLDIEFLRNLPRQRDLPDIWLLQHNGDVLDEGHYVAALAYIVGDEVDGRGRCSQDVTKSTARLSGKCIKLPRNMPVDARVCFSKTPTCVGCRYWAHLQRRPNDCDWNPDRRQAGDPSRGRRTSKKARLSDEEDYSGVESSTGDSVDSGDPGDTTIPETERDPSSDIDLLAFGEQPKEIKDTTMEIDDAREEPAPRKTLRPESDTHAAARQRETSPGLAAGRERRNNTIPRMQEWEYNEGRLFDPSGRWAVAWSAPYNTGRDAFHIAPQISMHRIRLGPGDKHTWEAETDKFRDAMILSGEIDLKMDSKSTGTLTQGSVFKIQPGDNCSVQNRCVEEASLLVHVVENFLRLTAH